jgi:rRNA maturation RNase YbeY
LSLEGVEKSGEITFCFVDNNDISKLNLLYLAKNIPTDVLVFDLSENQKEITADIIISCDTALSNASLYKTSLDYELALYCIHGLLHILGYDDQDKKKAQAMHNRQLQLLKQSRSNILTSCKSTS